MPSVQITKNCHYISRCLTRPWEAEQRRLHFFDFETGWWDDGASRTLFAEIGLNVQSVETWLDRVIEGPLSLCRKKLTAGETNALEDWGFYRAATLMLWLQGMRVRSVSDHDVRRSIEQLAACSTEETDKLVIAIRHEYDLALATTVVQDGMIAPLYFPSSGVFPISYPDSGCLSGHAVALGLPLDVMNAIIALPRENTGKRDVTRIPASMSNMSVGITSATRVVVPPDLLREREQDDVARILRDVRVENDKLLGLVTDSKRLVADAYQAIGLVADQDRAGRFPPHRRR